jgi:hypothetical protein
LLTGRRFTLMSLAAVAALSLAPAAASAANRYASPTGTGVDPCDDPGTPCPIATAVNQADSGDDVTLLGGVPPAAPFTSSVTLGFAGTPITGITIHGSPGARPVVNFTTGGGEDGFFLGDGSTLRDVVTSSTSDATVLIDAIGGTVERVSAHTDGTAETNYTCVGGRGAVFRDSVCWFSGPADISETNSAFAAFSQEANDTVTLRNVTVFAPNANGLNSVGQGGFSMTVSATNVIAHGGTTDVRTADFSGGGTSPATVALDHSNYATETETSGAITDPGTGTNQLAPPVFVNAAIGDFHEAPASTATLDLGIATGLLPGELDPDGAARVIGPGPDIGAYESTVPVSTPAAGAAPGLQAPIKKKCKKKKKKHRAAAAKKCKKKK